jgi:hypothetical protein
VNHGVRPKLKHTYRSRTGAIGLCGVDIYECFDSLTVVLTELNGNRGIAVTDCFPELATDIASGLVEVGIVADPRSILWIERTEGAYSPKAPWNGETWDEVTMQWDGRRFRAPVWKPCAGDRFKRPALGKSIRPHEISIRL